MVTQTTLRPAIAMIELIFAIVVLGIVLMSAPTLIGVATKSGSSGSTASFQESITEASSLVKLITTRYWDQNDTNNTAPLLHLNLTPAVVDASFPGRVSRQVRDGTGAALLMSPIGIDPDGQLNDMDDFNGRETNMTLAIGTENAEAGKTDYIDFQVQLSSQVQYGKSGIPLSEPFAGTLGGITNTTASHTKLISVSLTSPHFPDKNITLSTFTCNIGSFKLRELGVNR